MSHQQRLEKARADFAWKCILKIKGLEKKKIEEKYSSLVRGAPADIQINGLGQSASFWRAKGYERGNPGTKDEQVAHASVLEHITEWLQIAKHVQLNSQNLVEWISGTEDTNQYRLVTSETIALLAWLKRFAEAELA